MRFFFITNNLNVNDTAQDEILRACGEQAQRWSIIILNGVCRQGNRPLKWELTFPNEEAFIITTESGVVGSGITH